MLTGVREITPQQYVSMLKHTIKCGGNLMVFAMAGSGKTEIAQSTIESMGYRCVYLNLSVLEAPDLVGVPRIDGDVMRYATPYFLPYKDTTEKPVVILIDEVDKAKAELQNPCLELYQFRTVNGRPLNVQAVISTANMPDEGAFSLPMNHALTNRCSVFKLETSFQDWRNWAVDASINPLVINFLEKNIDLLQQKPNKDDPTAYCRPSPRSWTLAARELDSLDKNCTLDEQTMAVSGRIGVDAATKFRVWMEHYRYIYPMVDELVKSGKGPTERLTIDRQLVFAIAACNEISKLCSIEGNTKPSADTIKKTHAAANHVFTWLMNLTPEMQIAGFKSVFKSKQLVVYKLMDVPSVFNAVNAINEAISSK
jgi:hypothetical protein